MSNTPHTFIFFQGFRLASSVYTWKTRTGTLRVSHPQFSHPHWHAALQCLWNVVQCSKIHRKRKDLFWIAPSIGFRCADWVSTGGFTRSLPHASLCLSCSRGMCVLCHHHVHDFSISSSLVCYARAPSHMLPLSGAPVSAYTLLIRIYTFNSHIHF